MLGDWPRWLIDWVQVLMLNDFTYKIAVNLVLQGSEGNEAEKVEDWQCSATNDFPVHSVHTVNKWIYNTKFVVNLVLQGSEGYGTEKVEDWQCAATNDFLLHSVYTVNKMDLQYQQFDISSPFLYSLLNVTCNTLNLGLGAKRIIKAQIYDDLISCS